MSNFVLGGIMALWIAAGVIAVKAELISPTTSALFGAALAATVLWSIAVGQDWNK